MLLTQMPDGFTWCEPIRCTTRGLFRSQQDGLHSTFALDFRHANWFLSNLMFYRAVFTPSSRKELSMMASTLWSSELLRSAGLNSKSDARARLGDLRSL